MVPIHQDAEDDDSDLQEDGADDEVVFLVQHVLPQQDPNTKRSRKW